MSINSAMSVFVSLVLASLAAAVLSSHRRRAHHFFLAMFLGLVSLNFLATMSGNPFGIRQATVERIALLTLAWDPFFFLAFVALYPFPQTNRAIRMALVAGCVSASVMSLLIVIHSGSFWTTSLPSHPVVWAVLVQLWLVYVAVWVLGLWAVRAAPTPRLQRQAQWTAIAIGAAVVPRIGLATTDIGLRLWLGTLLPNVKDLPGVFYVPYPHLVEVLCSLPIIGVGLAAPHIILRTDPRSMRSVARPVFVIVGILVVVAMALLFLQPLSHTYPFGLRWIVFGVILGYSVLSADILDLQRFRRGVVAPFSGVVAGLAVFLFGAAILGEADVEAPATMWVLVGLAVPIGLVVFMLVHTGSQTIHLRAGVATAGDRRLLLYRSAVEAAWAEGRPDAARRRQLDAHRRHLQLRRAEAMAIESIVVSDSFQGRGIGPGTEIAPGIVVQHQLAKGAQGKIFACHDYARTAAVVAKVIGDGSPPDKQARAALFAEATALRGLVHPNVVGLRDVHQWKGHPVLLYEFVKGRTLAEMLLAGPLDPRDCRRVAKGLLAGLGAIHRAGIVHRDLKPDNVVVAMDGRPVITDFGIAWCAGGLLPARQTTITGFDGLVNLRGTLGYMAPEQLTSSDVTARADVFAVGAVLYQCITGWPAIDVAGHTLADALALARAPSIDMDRVPDPWRNLLRKALAIDPLHRFADAHEMNQFLGREFSSTVSTQNSTHSDGSAF